MSSITYLVKQKVDYLFISNSSTANQDYKMSRFFAGGSDSDSDSSSEDDQLIKAQQPVIQQTVVVSEKNFYESVNLFLQSIFSTATMKTSSEW